jgi:alkylation response protein AidB-like acyl-CoA dehydrogenase
LQDGTVIDFELTEEQQMIRDSVGAFAAEKIRPAAREADESGVIPAALVEQSWQLGLVAGVIPENLGGAGDSRSAITGAVTAEELACGDITLAAHFLAPRIFAYPILEFGTDDQRRAHLRRFSGANYAAGTAALVEPRFDFDLTDMKTTAHREGGSFVLSGVKCNVPLAIESESMLVYAVTDSTRGWAGIDAFVVDRSAVGVSISPREKNMGFKALTTYTVTLDGCRVDASARIGGDAGFNFSRAMSCGRIALGAMGVGLMRSAFDYARDYAKERKAFGAFIAQKQAIAFMLADMATEIDASRLLVWEAASRLDKGDDALKESYLARNYVANSALRVADNSVQVLGGHGYVRDNPVEMWLRNARGLSALEGIATV